MTLQVLFVNTEPIVPFGTFVDAVPAEFSGIATSPCVIVVGGTSPQVLPAAATHDEIMAVVQPLIQARVTTQSTLASKAQTALTNNIAALALPDPTPGNQTYLGHAAIPAGTLTTAVLSNIARQLSDQVDSLTRQNDALVAQVTALTRQMNAMIRLAQGLFDSTDGT
jgi:hypothetical protein